MRVAILGAESTGKTRLAQALTLLQKTSPPGIVLCDTAPFMAAIYSDVLLGDASLLAPTLQVNRGVGLTLVTGLDIPWVADGVQRDGMAVRTRVDQRLREVLQQHGIAYSTVYGQGEARTQCALQAIDFAWGAPRVDRHASPWKWNCEKCSDPACEHRLFRDLIAG